MAFSKIATGLQHIGIPTNDLNLTIDFYQSLGFELAHRTANGDEQVAFLKLGNLMIETYQNFKAARINGAVDHIAINVTDVEEARRIGRKPGVLLTAWAWKLSRRDSFPSGKTASSTSRSSVQTAKSWNSTSTCNQQNTPKQTKRHDPVSDHGARTFYRLR